MLSVWLIAIDPLINRDAIIYLRTADAYLQDGFIASQNLFGRPLISICFATLHQFTGIPLVYAGQLLNTLFYVLLNVGFVATVHALGGDRRIQWLAAVVILSHPILNDHRSSIMRDPAYWCFVILAFRQLLLYVRRPRLRHGLGWSCAILMAAMFRFEGLFFAALAPLTLLATRDLEHRLRHCLRLLGPILIAAAAIGLGLALYLSGPSIHEHTFPAIGTYLDRLLEFPREFSRLAAAGGAGLLEFSAREDAGVAIVAALAAILVLNLCRALTWPYVLALLWGIRHRVTARLRPDDATLLNLHLLIGTAYLALFTLINRFMLERYSCQVVIFLLLYLPFILNALWTDGDRRWKQALVVILLAGMSLDSLHNSDYQKAFIRDATHWLEDNTPADAGLVSNDKYIAYFSGRRVDWDAAYRHRFDLQSMLADEALWSGSDYLAMLVRRREDPAWHSFLERQGLEEAVRFGGGRHGSVAIVRLRAQPRWPDRSGSAADTSAGGR